MNFIPLIGNCFIGIGPQAQCFWVFAKPSPVSLSFYKFMTTYANNITQREFILYFTKDNNGCLLCFYVFPSITVSLGILSLSRSNNFRKKYTPENTWTWNAPRLLRQDQSHTCHKGNFLLFVKRIRNFLGNILYISVKQKENKPWKLDMHLYTFPVISSLLFISE